MGCSTAAATAAADDDDALGLQKNDVMLPLETDSCFLLAALPLPVFFATAFDIFLRLEFENDALVSVVLPRTETTTVQNTFVVMKKKDQEMENNLIFENIILHLRLPARDQPATSLGGSYLAKLVSLAVLAFLEEKATLLLE